MRRIGPCCMCIKPRARFFIPAHAALPLCPYACRELATVKAQLQLLVDRRGPINPDSLLALDCFTVFHHAGMTNGVHPPPSFLCLPGRFCEKAYRTASQCRACALYIASPCSFLLSALAVQVRHLLQRLTNITPLGKGIQGSVYSAYDRRIKGWVAVKLAMVKVVGSNWPFEQVRMGHTTIG